MNQLNVTLLHIMPTVTGGQKEKYPTQTSNMNCRVVTCSSFYWVNPSSKKIKLGLPINIRFNTCNLQERRLKLSNLHPFKSNIPHHSTICCASVANTSLTLEVVICTAGWCLSSNPLTVASRRLRPIAYHHHKGPSSCEESSDSLNSCRGCGEFLYTPENEFVPRKRTILKRK